MNLRLLLKTTMSVQPLKGMRLVRTASLIVIISILYSLTGSFTFAASEINQNPSIVLDNLRLNFNNSGGIDSVLIDGMDCSGLENTNETGFYIMDVQTETWYNAAIELKGSSDLVQSGEIKNTGLYLNAQYSSFKNTIKIDGTIEDLTGQDRMIKVQYRVPFSVKNMIWYNDLNTTIKINSESKYSSATSMADSQRVSTLPFGVVSNGEYSIAAAQNMNAPYSVVIEYDNAKDSRYLSISFNFVLSAITEKTKSKADFSFVIYAPDPEWGMRSAAQTYYDIFPEYFTRRVEEGGNWLFQQDYTKAYGLEDFGFKYNETPNFLDDKNNSVYSLRYIAPSEKWIGWPERQQKPEPTYNEFVDRLLYCLNMSDNAVDYDFKIGKTKDSAQAVLNSGVYADDGKMKINSWYAYGPMVNFVVNGSPSVPGLNYFNLCEGLIKEGQRQASQDGSTLKGIYIDNMGYPGGFNYRDEHLKYSKYPLLWDSSLTIALPQAYSQYEFAEGIHNIAVQTDRYVLANFAFPLNGTVMYVPLIDIPSGEIGADWGDTFSEFSIRRTLAYRKPWTLLLTQHVPSGEVKELSYEQREKIMRRGMVYGVFSNIIGLQPAIDAYDVYRPIFRKYLPAIKLADRYGWNPLTYARADKDDIIIERYGSMADNNCLFTMINTNESKAKDYIIAADCQKLGLDISKAESLIAYDLLTNRIINSSYDASRNAFDFSVTLTADEAAAVLVGTREEIFNQLSTERIEQALNRAKTALSKLPDKFAGVGMDAPEKWEQLSIESDEIFKSLINLSYADSAPKLVNDIRKALLTANEISENIEIYKNYFDADIKYVYTDVLALLNGLYDLSDETGENNKIPAFMIISIAAAISVIVIIAIILAIHMNKRRKKKNG